MNTTSTLRAIAGLKDCQVDWQDAALILIDFQNEYISGSLPLGSKRENAIHNASKILAKARKTGVPIFHVQHLASAASPVFNPTHDASKIIAALTPDSDEPLIQKSFPNAFHNTELGELLDLTNRKQLIICGFMSHMCVTATTIRALELGYNAIVIEDACATRALSLQGKLLADDIIHAASMAALADRYATVITTSELALA